MKRDYVYRHPDGGTAFSIAPDGYLIIRVHEYVPRHYVMTYGGEKKITREYRRVSLRQAWQLFRPEIELFRKKIEQEKKEMETTLVRFITGKRTGQVWELVGEWNDIYSVEIAPLNDPGHVTGWQRVSPTMSRRVTMWADPKHLELVSS